MTDANVVAQAQVYLESNRAAAAARALGAHLATNPDDAEAWRVLARTRTQLAQHVRARKAARRAQLLEPHRLASCICVIYADVGAGKIRRSTRRAVSEALRIAPDEPSAHSAAGAVAKVAGRLRTADRHYRRALSINPNDQVARHGLAIVDAERGNIGGSVAGLVGVVATDPRYQQAVMGLKNVTRFALLLVDLLLLFVVVLIGVYFRDFTNALGAKTSIEPPGMTLRAVAAIIAVAGIVGFVLRMRTRAGVYFARYLRSLPAISPLLVVLCGTVALCVVALCIAIFVDGLVAVRIYELTGVSLVVVFVVNAISGLVRR